MVNKDKSCPSSIITCKSLKFTNIWHLGRIRNWCQCVCKCVLYLLSKQPLDIKLETRLGSVCVLSTWRSSMNISFHRHRRYLSIYGYVCVFARVYVYLMCECVCMYACMCLCVCVCVCVCLRVKEKEKRCMKYQFIFCVSE